ncbi:MAG: CoA transferase [Dehalococcoidia bacterium]
MSLPLSDIRVVDFATVFSAPFAAMLLADQGADVIKIEPPDGDTARTSTPVPGTADLSLGFLAFNRNKRSVTLDITKPEGREAAYRLCQWADVLIINMRVDTRRRRGFTYEELAAINPRLIYLSLTGYGDEGPDADLPGVDIVIQARTGDIEGRQEAGNPPPPHTRLYHFDMATSMMAAYAVTVALRERDRTGVGRKVEVSLLQTGVSLHATQMTKVLGMDTRFPTKAVGTRSVSPGQRAVNTGAGLRQIYRCADDRYILNMFINTGPRWDSLCQTLQLDELAGDPRFDSAEHRAQHTDAIAEILDRHLLTKPAAEWEAIFKAAGHTTSIVKEVEEVFDDPQVIANDMIAQFEQPGLGEVRAVGLPFRMSPMSEEPWLRRPAPRLGEHTEEVLRVVGYSPDEIGKLRASGALG